MTLAEALRLDMARSGETRAQYADRRGISKRTLDSLLDRQSTGAIAQLLAAEIVERLGDAAA